MVSRARPGLCAALAAVAATAACAGLAVRRFPERDALWRDPDDVPFAPCPKKYFGPSNWDVIDQTIASPIARLLAVSPGGEAINVHALDEVPDSSWFTNRIGDPRRPGMDLPAFGRGACTGPPLDTAGPWVVIGAKPDGATPGFPIEAPDGRRAMLKFDGLLQPERGSAADAVGAILYHAAGYFVPCNEVLFFDRSILRLGPKATVETRTGKRVPLEWKHVEAALSKGLRMSDGRYRAGASHFVAGIPNGPWTYQGVKRDDPNDVVPHEDRRELRGSRVLAAWVSRIDSREKNTLATWMGPKDGTGHLRHWLIDFSDGLGTSWANEMLGRKFGYSYYLDFGHIGSDFISLGAIPRPWDSVTLGKAGVLFGYWDVEHFDPEAWHVGYPNPAFGRMTERDAAWAARIVARVTDAHVDVLVEAARLASPIARAEMRRILIGRRDKILRRWLGRLSPLADPDLRAGEGALCLTDLAVQAGIVAASDRRYVARGWVGDRLTPLAIGALAADGAHVCLTLPRVPGATPAAPGYLVVDVTATSGAGKSLPPARLHLYDLAPGWRLVGLERPAGADAPRP